jgi:putative endonuclease
MYTVYVIYNREVRKSYTGQTDDIARRLRQHNDHTFKGYTARYRGKWELIYSESVATRSDALKREKQLKSGNGREFVKTFVPASSSLNSEGRAC